MSALRLCVAQKSTSVKGTCGFLLGGYSGEFGATDISKGGCGFAGVTGGRPNSSGGILKLMTGPWDADVLACASSRRFWSVEREDFEFAGTKSKIREFGGVSTVAESSPLT